MLWMRFYTIILLEVVMLGLFILNGPVFIEIFSNVPMYVNVFYNKMLKKLINVIESEHKRKKSIRQKCVFA